MKNIKSYYLEIDKELSREDNTRFSNINLPSEGYQTVVFKEPNMKCKSVTLKIGKAVWKGSHKFKVDRWSKSLLHPRGELYYHIWVSGNELTQGYYQVILGE